MGYCKPLHITAALSGLVDLCTKLGSLLCRVVGYEVIEPMRRLPDPVIGLEETRIRSGYWNS